MLLKTWGLGLRVRILGGGWVAVCFLGGVGVGVGVVVVVVVVVAVVVVVV